MRAENILRDQARCLRKEQTPAEQKRWAYLRNRPLGNAKFRRQHVIGSYIADFCCPEPRLIVELDGGHHMAQMASDQRPSLTLARQGYRVLRFWNHEVLRETDAVLGRISEELAGGEPE